MCAVELTKEPVERRLNTVQNRQASRGKEGGQRHHEDCAGRLQSPLGDVSPDPVPDCAGHHPTLGAARSSSGDSIEAERSVVVVWSTILPSRMMTTRWA